jgi:serine protease
MTQTTTSIRSAVATVVAAGVLLMVAGDAGRAQQTSGRQTRQEQIGAAPRPFDRAPGRLRFSPERYARLSQAAAEGLDYVPGEVLVKFREGASALAQAATLASVPGRPSRDGVRWVGDVAVVTSDAIADARALASMLEIDPDVLWAEPNYLARVGPSATGFSAPLSGGARTSAVPNDPEYAARQWNLDEIDMPGAWEISPGGSASVIVAVLDTGVTTETRTIDFPLWTGSSFVNAAVPFAVSTDLSSSRFVEPMDLVFFESGSPVLDMDGHGTHVASILAGDTNNNLGSAGIAYNVRIMPVKVCVGYWELMFARGLDGIPGFADEDGGGCPFDALAEGIRYAADNGAKVINMSLGGTSQSEAMRSAISYAVGRGVFLAFSGGNRGDEDNEPGYPASYAPQFGGAMAVAAVGRSLTKAFYSSTGSYIEIAAPGGDGQDGGAAGVIWQTTLRQSDLAFFLDIPRFDRYDITGFQGTSMAAPHVAGLAALLVSRGVTSPSAIESIITQSARDLGASGRDDEFGSGLIQARDALFGRGIR